jgi:putative membrane protein
VDSVGLESIEISTTTVLKAFLAHWMENLNAPIERLFENFGKEKTIAFSLLGIKTEAHLKSVLVVSSFHPGPFSSVGSSLLPFLLQKAIEKKTGCVVSVPHGLYGHEFDLPSQKENRKVLKGVLNSTDFANFQSKATKFVSDQKSAASASCQIFGDSAILTLTLSPKTTEDFPQELGDFICKKATQLGLKHVMIINAHNSINGPFDVKSAVESLKMVASTVLHKASRLTPSSFKVGAARVVPREFSLEDGMGYGGICAIVVKVEDQTCVYITIDGNNMIAGLRERILRSLKELGVNAGEVLTTDTHAVNAIVMTKRGYHPIGEAIPHAKLISYIKTAVQKALNSMESASSAWRTGEVPGVKVIGERQIEKMALLAERSLRRAKRTAIPLFASVGLLLIGLLAIL